MLNVTRAPAVKDWAEFASAWEELLCSTLRNLMLITDVFCLIVIVVLAGNSSPSRMAQFFVVAVVLILPSLLAHRLLDRHYIAAQIVWQAGLVAGVTTAALMLEQPEIAMVYVLFPLISAIAGGWPAGLLTELVILVLSWALTQVSFAPPLSAEYGWAIVVAGAFTGLLGLTSTNTFLAVTQWSLFSFNQARQNLAEARDQAVILKQTQEDLVQANRGLARLSDRLNVMQRIAEEARQAKAEFVANVSHELRTPLNMIIGFADVISQSSQVYGVKLPPVLLTDIAAIQRNSQHLSNLVNDVLDLSQVEAGRMALSRERANLQEIIVAAVSVVRALYESKGLDLKTDVPEDLELFCDTTRIRQVIINLLSNAGRFTERGGVQVTCKVEEGNAIVSVTDTGSGIAAEDQKKIFEPFQQLDGSIRRRYGGSGLGLTISKQFVEMHGGRMWLESRVGVGTTISFALPLGAPLPAAPNGIRDTYKRSFIPGDEYGYTLRSRPSRAPMPVVLPRLVLLEKEHSLQRILSRYTQETEIIAVKDMDEAISELERSPAQMLLINQSPFDEIPDGTLAHLPYDTPAVTCWVPGENEAARQLGVAHYLVKPVSREKIIEAIDIVGGEVKTVLIVDDEPDELHLFARALATDDRRYQILQVTNGRRALSMLRSRHPDVMLLDLMMPGMNGFQVLEEKSRDPSIQNIPVLVITSRDPTGGPVVGNTFSVTHGNGLSVHTLIASIQAIGEILSPAPRT